MRHEVEFDEEGLLARVRNASRDFLKRAGVYIRSVARRKIATCAKPSLPGSPPHSRRGLLKRGILFGLDSRERRVLIGPGFRFVGESASAHEFGGKYRKERYPKRPLMGPALKESIPHIARLWDGAVK